MILDEKIFFSFVLSLENFSSRSTNGIGKRNLKIQIRNFGRNIAREIFISEKIFVCYIIPFPLGSTPNDNFIHLSPGILSHYKVTLIIFRALEISSSLSFSFSNRRKSWCQYDPRISIPCPSFFPFPSFLLFFTSISNYSFWHISFNRVAHRKKSNYLPFLLAFRQHRFPLFRDKEILSPIVPFIFREDNLPFLISLFIASHFESFAQRKNETSSSNRIYKTVNVKILNGSFVFKEGRKKKGRDSIRLRLRMVQRWLYLFLFEFKFLVYRVSEANKFYTTSDSTWNLCQNYGGRYSFLSLRNKFKFVLSSNIAEVKQRCIFVIVSGFS